MPPLICSRCQRASPAEANYCHHDGNPLRQVAAARSPNQLPHDFVFPSGRNCRTFDELVQVSQEEWGEAKDLLRRGVFHQFLAGSGRMDLARAAQKAQSEPDLDIGLTQFLGTLPALKPVGPKLDLKPRRLALGAVKAGEIKKVRLTIANRGKGQLHGSISVTSGEDWIRLGDGPDATQRTLKIATEETLLVQIDTRGQASRQQFSGKLTVITNGGVAEVPVTMEIAAAGFEIPPFEGAASPRELAEKMRAQPKLAVPLLENGIVAQWFASNGWVYPVPATPARGVAIVQQFFEGMGLAKPPPLALTEKEARFILMYPEAAQGQVTLRTNVKKWVYASVETNQAWLRVLTPSISGPQQATLRYEVDSSLMDEGRHVGAVVLTANGGQQLHLTVQVDVRRPQQPFTRRLLRPFLAGAILFMLLRIALIPSLDLFARMAEPPPGEFPAGSFETYLSWPDHPLFFRRFVVATGWVGIFAGPIAVAIKGGRVTDVLAASVSGGFAGLIASITLACVAPFLDIGPWLVWTALGPVVPEHNRGLPFLWTPVWILLAVVSWTILGAFIGFGLRLAGPFGLELLAALGAPLAWVARLMGMRQTEALFAMR